MEQASTQIVDVVSTASNAANRLNISAVGRDYLDSFDHLPMKESISTSELPIL